MVTQRKRTFGWLAVILSALIIFALSVALAAAHNTEVTKSDPADGSTVDKSPAQVVAQFSEELVTKSSTMKVIDAAGKQVSDGDGKVDLNDPNHQTMIATLPASLPDGVYTVQWHAVLTDGDASDGTFSFTVQANAAPAQADPATTSTATPTTEPAPTATSAPTATVQPASVSAAAAQPPAAAPSVLPTTGGKAGWLVGWLLAGMIIVLATVMFSVLLRRGAR